MTNINVLVTTYNRCEELKLCLKCLFNQVTDGHFAFDVTVVDNNSNDQTRSVVRTYEEYFPGRVSYKFEPRQGKCFALNTGVGDAKGDFLAFTDDDAQPEPFWLRHLWHCFQTHNCDGVGGRILPVYRTKAPGWVIDNIKQLAGPLVIYDYGETTKRYEKPMPEFLGANYAFKRQVFDDCGLFRTDIGPGKGTLGDDTEFVARAQKAGKNLLYCGQAVVRHPVDFKRLNLSYIAKWNIALGKYRVLVDEGGKIDPDLLYWFGMPRYLLGQIARDCLNVVCSVPNPTRFLCAWIQLSRNLGRAVQMRSIYYAKTH